MRRLFALALVVCLWLGFAPSAMASIAGDNVAGLTPAAKMQRSSSVRPMLKMQRLKLDLNSMATLACCVVMMDYLTWL